jgi:hypothetical protein
MRGSDELSLRLETDDPLAQCRKSAPRRLSEICALANCQVGKIVVTL